MSTDQEREERLRDKMRTIIGPPTPGTAARDLSDSEVMEIGNAIKEFENPDSEDEEEDNEAFGSSKTQGTPNSCYRLV